MNCLKCGSNIPDGENFCSNCGAAVPKDSTPIAQAPVEPSVNPIIVNENINNPQVPPAQDVQPQTIPSVSMNTPQTTPTIPQQYATVPTHKKKNKWWLIVLIIGLSLIIAATGIVVIPDLLVTPEKLMAKGDFISAYEKADEEQKDEIVKINAVAVCSALCKESLKDSESFDLREAWYREDSYAVILTVAANNSYGNTVINYWYYYWSESDLEYKLMSSLTSLEDEEINSWDDSDERLEKAIDNLSRSVVKITMNMKNAEINKEDIKVINTLSEQNILETVELIDIYRHSSDEM